LNLFLLSTALYLQQVVLELAADVIEEEVWREGERRDRAHQDEEEAGEEVWCARTSQSTGHTYYLDTVNQKSSWILPPDVWLTRVSRRGHMYVCACVRAGL
jgi:hypothetical protein